MYALVVLLSSCIALLQSPSPAPSMKLLLDAEQRRIDARRVTVNGESYPVAWDIAPLLDGKRVSFEKWIADVKVVTAISISADGVVTKLEGTSK